jgi:hypothetical protein
MKNPKENKGCVTLWPCHLHENLRQKKNYENSNISPCKNTPNLQKNPLKRNQKPSRYYYNSIRTNLKFQHKPKISPFKNPHITNNIYTEKLAPRSLLSWHFEVYCHLSSWSSQPTKPWPPFAVESESQTFDER